MLLKKIQPRPQGSSLLSRGNEVDLNRNTILSSSVAYSPSYVLIFVVWLVLVAI